MTQQELLNIGKFIQIKDTKKYNYNNICCVLHCLPKDTYNTYKQNEHHVTTSFTRTTIIPQILKICNTQFNPNDFIIIPNNEGIYDLSYLKPKYDYNFNITSFTYNIQYDCKFDGLVTPPVDFKVRGRFTKYHQLYAFPHSCSRIINYNCNNDKKLFVSGDSQLLASIPILACYFKEVWYMDNRDPNLFLENKYKDIYFDYAIFAIGYYTLEKYMYGNLK